MQKKSPGVITQGEVLMREVRYFRSFRATPAPYQPISVEESCGPIIVGVEQSHGM